MLQLKLNQHISQKMYPVNIIIITIVAQDAQEVSGDVIHHQVGEETVQF